MNLLTKSLELSKAAVELSEKRYKRYPLTSLEINRYATSFLVFGCILSDLGGKAHTTFREQKIFGSFKEGCVYLS